MKQTEIISLSKEDLQDKLTEYLNVKILKLKLILVSTLIIVAVIAIPVISWPGSTFKFVKHARNILFCHNFISILPS